MKSLVFVAPPDEGPEPIVCLVSGQNRVDVARLAAVTGEPDIRRATAREAHELDRLRHRRHPADRLRPADARGHGSRTSGATRRVWAAAGLPTAVFEVPAGHAAHAGERDGRADHRGAPSGRAVGPGDDPGPGDGDSGTDPPAEHSEGDAEANDDAGDGDGGADAERRAVSPRRGRDRAPGTIRVAREPRNATITYPGGLRARWRWGGSGQAPRSSR